MNSTCNLHSISTYMIHIYVHGMHACIIPEYLILSAQPANIRAKLIVKKFRHDIWHVASGRQRAFRRKLPAIKQNSTVTTSVIRPVDSVPSSWDEKSGVFSNIHFASISLRDVPFVVFVLASAALRDDTTSGFTMNARVRAHVKEALYANDGHSSTTTDQSLLLSCRGNT